MKTAKISSGGSVGISMKFRTSKNFLLYGTIKVLKEEGWVQISFSVFVVKLCGVLLKNCIYCASVPSLHRESTDFLIAGYCGVNFFHPSVNYSDPTPPTDGSIDPYQNTTEGAEISFGCNPGFVPSARMTATCTSNGMWTPVPADLTCTCEHLL